jgi:hypothetical protein
VLVVAEHLTGIHVQRAVLVMQVLDNLMRYRVLEILGSARNGMRKHHPQPLPEHGKQHEEREHSTVHSRAL